MPVRDAVRTPGPTRDPLRRAPVGQRTDRLRGSAERWWRTRVLARRRLLAAGLAAVAVLAALRATAPVPPPSDRVWVAARDVPAGAVLGQHDLAQVAWPDGATPDGLLARPVGRTVSTGLRRGEPVTDTRVVGAAMMAAHPGRVALGVRVPDPTTVGLLRVGEHVDLVAADPAEGTARTVARDALVVALPVDAPGAGASPGGRVVVVAVAPDEAGDVGVSAVRDFLTVVWRDRSRGEGWRGRPGDDLAATDGKGRPTGGEPSR